MSLPRTRIAAVLLTALALAGCGSGDQQSTGDDRGQDGATTGDFVSGSTEEWLAAVCDDDEVTENPNDSASLEARYGPGATSAFYCNAMTTGDVQTYVEAALFDADPSSKWNAPPSEGQFKNYAIGQVSDTEWAVVYEDAFGEHLENPHLAPLTEFGFDVVINNEPVS